MIGRPLREILTDNKKKYGAIYRFDVGNMQTVFLTEYEDIVEAFKTGVDKMKRQTKHQFQFYPCPMQTRLAVEFGSTSAGSPTCAASTWTETLWVSAQGYEVLLSRNASPKKFELFTLMQASGSSKFKEHKKFTMSALSDIGVGKTYMEDVIVEEVKLV